MSRSAGVPLRRPRLGSVSLAEGILDAIPYYRWVTASDIAAQVGVSAHKVAGLIRYHIPHACIEEAQPAV